MYQLQFRVQSVGLGVSGLELGLGDVKPNLSVILFGLVFLWV